jgi:hypothetical protein
MAVTNRPCWYWSLLYLSAAALMQSNNKGATGFESPSIAYVRSRHIRHRRRLWQRRRQDLRLQGVPSADLSSTTSSSRDVFVVDWDGCLADTREWRASTALSVAQTVWPETREKLAQLNQSSTSLSWLHNKLAALSHVFCSDGNASVTCEYTLSARLLIDEQQLDQGRSSGRTGKYASKFHPRKNLKEPLRRRRVGDKDDAPSTGNQPLTVGEISANWNEGGMIRETLLVRYHCNRKFPLPALQQALDQHLCTTNRLFDSDRPRPKILPEVKESLLSAAKDRSILVTVRHASDLPMAVETLACAGVPCRIAPSLYDVQLLGVSVLVQTKSTVRDILEAAPMGTRVYVLSSCWTSLRKEVLHYGDDVPVRRRDRPDQPQPLVGPTEYGTMLCLGYAQWAPNTHPSLHSAATMNPWTTLVSLQELEELLSFQISTPE